MKIECCHNCENRHEKCHAHCEEYLTQKILKIAVEAITEKENRVNRSMENQKIRQIARMRHINHIRRQK